MARSKVSTNRTPMVAFSIDTHQGKILVTGREGGHWNITAPWDCWSYAGWESEVRAFIERKIDERA